jgi:hypothetical protein
MILLSILTACQTLTLPSSTGLVSSENRLPFPEGQNSGAWKGNYLVVDYKYSRVVTGTDMTGTVTFRENMLMNFTSLTDFHLGVIFLDENGKVIGRKGLTTWRGDLGQIPFRAEMGVPPATASIAFTYEGTAIEGGGGDEGGGVTRFFQYPG